MARRSEALLLAAAILAVAGSAACRNAKPGTARTPVVLISIDTLRADHLPAYGYAKVDTPNIDALRRDSVLYRNAYSHAPLTLPSHLSLLTGLLPPEHGVRDNLGYQFDSQAHPTLADRLRASGYASGAAVSAYVLRGATGLGRCFDFYDDDVRAPESTEAAALARRSGDKTVAAAVDWLGSIAGRPFLLFVHLYEPHYPYEPPEPFKSRYPLAYDGTIAAADAAVGTLLAELRRQGVYDQALILLVSDHGEGLGDHGEQEHGILLYREALHVPLLLKLPHARDAGKTVERAVGLVDVVPTVADVLGLQVPGGLAGRSLAGAESRRASRIYSETFYPRLHMGWSELRSIVDDEHHLIEGPRPELYAIVGDPRETRDLVRERSAVAASLQRELAGFGLELAAPKAVDADETEALRSLGYLAGGSRGPDGPRPNPRDRIGEHETMKAAFHLVREERLGEAVTLFIRILEREPGLFDARWELGTTLVRLGRYEQAADAFQAAMRLSPPLAGLVAVSLAQVEVLLGRLDAAESHARLGLEADAPRAHEVLARVALARGDLGAAEREAALVRGGESEGVRQQLVLAEVAIRRGRLEAALSMLDAARSRAGERPVRGLEFLRGDALGRLKRNAEAQAAFEREIREFPNDPQAYASLAIVMAVGGHPRGDVERLMQAMFDANPAPRSALLAAKTLEFLGAAEAGREWRRRGATLRPLS